MNSNIKKTWGLILTTEFILAQVVDGTWGVFFVWITFLFWEIWYLMVLDGVRAKAEKYYNEIVGRFKLIVGLIMTIETIFSVMSIITILGLNLFSNTILGVVYSVRFLAHSVLFIWQISMLMNAFAATMSAEEYKAERGKIALMLVFAPFGALAMRN
ncbi:MAG: hypothetical protein IJY67_08875 [Paludibacteraceae bacterium]|nr:hypothetical protein [Paludibacteraceae bacterium]